jgi:hypothetical protein
MILLDTTVLVYAVGAEHPLADPCRQIVTGVADGDLEATTTPEVIQELAHVRARRRGRNDAVEIASAFAVLLRPLVTVGSAHLERGLELFREHEALGAFDSVLAAVARDRGMTLVSADAAFTKVPDLVVASPDAIASGLGGGRPPRGSAPGA